MALDQAALEAFMERFGEDMAATIHGATVVVGDKLGLYRALAEGGPQTADELARRTGCHPRLVREWVNAQAASGYCDYEPATGRYALDDVRAACLADPSSPVFLAGGALAATAAHKAEEQVRAAFQGDGSVGWSEQHDDLFSGTDRFFGPRYRANLVSNWIPALDGVADKLHAGASVADVGCGYGASTILLAQAYPGSTFTGFDSHAASVAAAREAAAEAGLADRVSFEVADAEALPGTGYDLVAVCNALHEMGDPVAVCRRIRDVLDPEGTLLIVEPRAGDRPEDNLHNLGRVFYSTSTMVCVPNALAQGAEDALGAQAGEAALRRVAEDAGFTRWRRAAETPFNLVLEARP